MTQRHLWTLSLGWICLLVGLSFGTVGCSDNSNGPCQTDYNCPPERPFCVARDCVASLPGQEPAKESTSEPAPEPVAESADGGPRPEAATEKDPTSKACLNQLDCKDPTPWCRAKQCAEGYVFFDFREGLPVLDPDQDAQTACQGHGQCKGWQTCVRSGSNTFCYTLAGRKAEAKGKLRDDGIFMQGRAYALLAVEDGKEFVRLRMVGERSAKLEQHLDIDVPKALMVNGASYDVAKHDIRIRLYDVKIEFLPPIRELTAVGVRGSLAIGQARTSLSTRETNTLVIGSADLVLKGVGAK